MKQKYYARSSSGSIKNNYKKSIFLFIVITFFFENKQNQNVYTNRRDIFARGLPFERS